MTSPIATIIIDVVNVAKAAFRSFIDERMPHRFANADAVRAADLANVNLIFVSPRLYEKDTSDTTSADDGTTLIRDTNGIAFKHVAVGVAITSVQGAWDNATTYGLGALVSRGGFLFVSRIEGNLDNAPDDATPGDTTQWMLVPTIAGAEVTGTSTTSLTVGTGAKVFATQQGVGWTVGSRLRAASAANTSNYMEGRVTAYSGTSLTLTVDQTGGAGTFEDWNLGLAGDVGPAGADLGIPMRFNDGTTDADPGSGKWGVNNATLSAATEIYISEADVNGASIAAELAAWDDSTTTSNKGIVEIRKRDDAAAFVRYRIISGITDQGVYDKFTVVHLSSGGTLSDEDVCQVLFNQTGDAGADGGGAGDFVGPAGATDEIFVRFNTATGKAGQDGLVGADDNGNIFGANSLTVNEIATPTTPAAGKIVVYGKADGNLYIKDDAGVETDLTSGVSVDQVARDLAMTAFAKADIASGDAGAVFGDVAADNFTTDSLSVKTNATYDAAGDYYHNPATVVTYALDMGDTLTGSGEASGAYEDIFNLSTGGWQPGSTLTEHIWQIQFSMSQLMKSVGFRPTSGAGSSTGQFWEGSNNGTDWTELASIGSIVNNTVQSGDFAGNTTSYTYARLRQTWSAGNQAQVRELDISIAVDPPDITLRPSAVALPTADPSDVSVYVRVEDIDAVVDGTDRVVRVSIDGGTTWATATISTVGAYGAADTLLRADADVSAQTGSSLLWEITTANAKEQRIKQVAAVPLY